MITVKLLDGTLCEVNESQIEPGIGLVWINIGLALNPYMVLGVRI